MKNVSLKGLYEFASKQSGTYNFEDTKYCAFGQYLQSLGAKETFVYFESYAAWLDKTGANRIRGAYQDLHPNLAPILAGCASHDELNELDGEDRELDWTLLAKELERLIASE